LPKRGPRWLSTPGRLAAAVAIGALLAKGWPAFIGTPDSDQDLRSALAKRPYGVISNQPVRAKQLRDRQR
jgi:hypothetical protein